MKIKRFKEAKEMAVKEREGDKQVKGREGDRE
jgi:hypothetical protein